MSNPVCPHCDEGWRKCECGDSTNNVVSLSRKKSSKIDELKLLCELLKFQNALLKRRLKYVEKATQKYHDVNRKLMKEYNSR